MYQVIVADPPWAFADRLTMSKVRRGAVSQYPVLDLEDIKGLLRDRPDLVDVDAVCEVWVPSSMIKDGIAVVEAWGFEVSGTTTWVKTTKDGNGLAFGMGHTFRQCHEITISGRRGKIVGKCENKSQRSAYLAPNLRHSQKPENLQDSLEVMFPKGRKLELFARRTRSGWTCVGNEIDGLDVREALDGILSRRKEDKEYEH